MYDDNAITEESQDKFNRLEFVNNLSNLIKDYSSEECLVMGLIGEWGSGKTSILNLVCNNLEDYTCINFNPWVFSEQNNLFYKFFEELVNGLNKKSCLEEIKCNIISNLRDFVDSIGGSAYVSLQTISGQTVTIGGNGYLNINDKSNSIESLESLKEKINNDLLKLNNKIVVIIDNIDRLTDFEVKQIFRLVKSVADFKNIIYILSFDENMIIKSLTTEQVYNPNKYLEKIIQIPIYVPKMEDYSSEMYFSKLLKECAGDKINNFDFFETWECLNYFIKTVRDIKRFINHLEYYNDFLDGEINYNDFLLVLALQLFEHEIYDTIHQNKEFFIKPSEDYSDRNKISTSDRYNEFIKPVHLTSKEMDRVIARLFPKFNFLIKKNSNFNSSIFYEQQLRICDSATFDKYFTISVSKDKLSDKLVNSILESDDISYIENKVLEINDSDKTRDFLRKSIINIDKISNENIGLFVEFYLDIGDLLNFKPHNYFESKDIFLSRIVSDLLYKFKNQDERFFVLKNTIPVLNKSLNPLIEFIGIEDQVHGRYFSEKFLKSESEFLVNDIQLTELEKLTAINIKKWADDGRLINQPNLSEILYDWSLWENETVVSDYIEENIKNPNNFISLIKGFSKINVSLKLDVDPVKYDKSYHFDILGDFIDLNDLRVKTNEMSKINDSVWISHFLVELDKYLDG